ncbi:MAG: fluoride efflux transporter CrcB [Lachnospiraceae bacterium]|nr:fluoride efflux transporter CrcB [Lachnospiraceae bacterium]
MNFLFVALGGAVGAMGRYSISLLSVKTEFPFLTFITNIIGAVLIGFVVGISANNEKVSANTVLFWKTGVCGGFTTFSTFSLEAFNLLENKHYAVGGLYIFLSCLCCILGVLCGRKIAEIVNL